MSIQVFTDGASKANPGRAGAGVVIYEKGVVLEELTKDLGIKTNNEAEYLAVILALKYLEQKKITSATFFSDSDFLVKQLKGEYRVKSEKIKPLYEKVQSLLRGKSIVFHWIPREDNKKADELANKAIIFKESVSKSSSVKKEVTKLTKDASSESRTLNGLLIMERVFFGKINCLKLQLNIHKEVYIHLGLEKAGVWSWKKVKFSDVELGEMALVLRGKKDSCAFFHSFAGGKTQIWCKSSAEKFTIKIDEISKNLSLGEQEVLVVLLERCMWEMNLL